MWLADRMQPGNPAYNASFRWRLDGALAPDILERAFNEIVSRHEILRASFSCNGQDPVQLIAPVTPTCASRHAISDFFPTDSVRRKWTVCRRRKRDAAWTSKKGRLSVWACCSMEDQRHVLMLTIHHLVCDGWSISLIMEELQRSMPRSPRGGSHPFLISAFNIRIMSCGSASALRARRSSNSSTIGKRSLPTTSGSKCRRIFRTLPLARQTAQSFRCCCRANSPKPSRNSATSRAARCSLPRWLSA